VLTSLQSFRDLSATAPSQDAQSKVNDWKLGKLNHVAIAVPDLEKASQLYRDVLGADVSDVVVSFSSHHIELQLGSQPVSIQKKLPVTA